MRRAGLALSLVVLAFTVAACSVSIGGSDKIDRNKAEKFLRENIRPAVESVSCPSGVKIEKGKTFACTFSLPSGKTGTVTVHMTDEEGAVHVSDSDIHVSG